MNAKAIFLILLLLSVGVLFLVAGFSKILRIQSFVFEVHSFQILPPVLVVPFAFAIVAAETIFGTALMVGLFTRIDAAVMSTLTAAFIVAIGINLIRGNIVAFGFFGIFVSDLISSNILLRNLVLLGALLTRAFQRIHPFSLDLILAKRCEIGPADDD